MNVKIPIESLLEVRSEITRLNVAAGRTVFNPAATALIDEALKGHLPKEPSVDDLYTKPAPSLCDTCSKAYHMSGGIIMVGGKAYRQRYCQEQRSTIHLDGPQKCAGYTAK